MTRNFAILERAPEYPFKCIISGLSTNVVDMEKYVEGYGRVYISVNVIADMAAKLGFMLDTEAEALRAEVAAAREAENRYPAILEEFVHGVSDLADRARASAHDSGAGDGGGDDGSALAGALADAIGPHSDRAAARAGTGSAVDDSSGRAGADAHSPVDHPDFDQPGVSSD